MDLGLDPGIEELVELLRSHGFETTDSGDGVSKPEDARVFDVPHIFATVASKDMVSEADRLQALLESEGYHWLVEATYSPDEADAHLFCRPPYSHAEQVTAMEGTSSDKYNEGLAVGIKLGQELALKSFCIHCLGPTEKNGKCKNNSCIGAEFSYENPNGWPAEPAALTSRSGSGWDVAMPAVDESTSADDIFRP